MSLTRDIAFKLGDQLREDTTTASIPLSSEKLKASSLKHPKFANAIATKLNRRLSDCRVKSLTFSKLGSAELVVTCEIHPVEATN